MNILGEKILLRAIDIKDAEMLLDIINDPDTEKMLGGFSFPVSLENQKKWISELNTKGDLLRCIIADKKNESIGLGTIILSDIDYKNGTAQIHIKLASAAARGKGFGTDAVNTMVNYAFNELRLNCIYAEVLEYNIPSQKLFRKCEFEQDGLLRSRIFKMGKYIDVISFSKVKKSC